MKQNKYLFRISLGLLLFCGLSACDNDDSEETHPTIPFSKIELTETITGDAPTVYATYTFLYNRKGRVNNYTSQQRFTAIEPVEMKQETTVTYANHQAVVVDDLGNKSIYTLNDKGYAVSCTRMEGELTRTYFFAYLVNTEGKYYLTNITEKLNDGKIYSSIDINYSFKDLRITYKMDTFQQIYRASTLVGQEKANTSEIPCLFLAELYPLSLHNTALYGKLLGEPFNTLINRITIEGNSASNETITYTYQTNSQGIVTSCKAVTDSYGTDYVRTVNYTIE